MRSIDGVLSQSYENDFSSRQEQVYSTVHRLALVPEDAIIFGSAGLALHGLDAFAKTRGSDPFDVDAFITQPKLESLADRYSRLAFLVKVGRDNDRISIHRPLTRIPFTGFSSALCDFDGPRNSYEGTRQEAVELNGVATLPATTLAMMKLRAGRRKDIAGLLQAHMVGESQGHPIVQEESWQELIATAVAKVQASDDVARYGTARYPSWMTDLVAVQFNHSAFRAIPH